MKAIIYSLSAFLVLIVTSCNTQETIVGNGNVNTTENKQKQLSPSELEMLNINNNSAPKSPNTNVTSKKQL